MIVKRKTLSLTKKESISFVRLSVFAQKYSDAKPNEND